MFDNSLQEIYDDELYYSVLSRISVNTLLSSDRICVSLFGTDQISLHQLVPQRLTSFLDNAESSIHLSMNEDDLVENLTILPAYSSHLSLQKYNLLKSLMIGEQATGVNLIKFFKTARYHLKFCPICIEEDRLNCQETFWHRSHQIPGLTICIKHKCFLHTWHPDGKQWDKKSFFPAESVLSRTYNAISNRDSDLLQDSTILVSILNKERSIKISRNDLLQYASLANYHLKSSKYYGYQNDSDQFLKYLNLFDSAERSKDLVRKWLMYLHQGDDISERYPLLFVQFYSFLQNLTKVNKMKSDYSEFHCVNMFCENYEKPRIKKYGHVRLGKGKNIEGICLVCEECGMIFSISYNKPSETHGIHRYGKKFIDGIKALINAGVSMRQVSIQTKVPARTIAFLLERGMSEKQEKFLTRRDNMRKNWESGIRSEDFRTFSLLKVKLNSEYLWLRKNNKRWLYDSLKLIKEIGVKQVSRDEDVLRIIQREYNCLLKLNVSHRLSKNYILTLLGFIDLKLKYFPLTRKFLNENCEDIVDYRIRKFANYLNNEDNKQLDIRDVLNRFKLTSKPIRLHHIEQINTIVEKSMTRPGNRYGTKIESVPALPSYKFV